MRRLDWAAYRAPEFAGIDPDAGIAALPGAGATKYPPVTGAEHLRSRLDATYRGKP